MNLDRLTVQDGTVVDSARRQVVLRGMVTITSNVVQFPGGQMAPVELDERNFDQLASWGFNLQQIRLEAGRLGVLECDPDPAYLEKLDRWVSWGAERGIYAIFKMTTYDVPSLNKDGAGGGFNRQNWQQFWDRDDVRADRIEAWRRAWTRFAGRPEVIGYDILNEPFIGFDTPTVVTDGLYPFYEAAGKALREVDHDALLIVQPISGGGMVQALGGKTPHGDQAPLSDRLSLYAPHYYVDLQRNLSWDEHVAEMNGILEEGRQVGSPTIIGEFGSPNASFRLGQMRVLACNEEAERLKGKVFDHFGLSAVRPWYIDRGLWAVLDPGWEETWRLRAVVRPYPQRVAGRAPSWSFDHDTRKFSVTIEADGDSSAPTVIVTLADRFYPSGARVALDGNDITSEAGPVGRTLELAAGVVPAGEHELVIEPA